MPVCFVVLARHALRVVFQPLLPVALLLYKAMVFVTSALKVARLMVYVLLKLYIIPIVAIFAG